MNGKVGDFLVVFGYIVVVMFGFFGFWEVFFIVVLVFLIFGLKKLLEVGCIVGCGMFEFCKVMSDFKCMIEYEINLEEL